MKILVIGKDGQLGRSIQKQVLNEYQTDEFIFVGRSSIDLSQAISIKNFFRNKSFDLIINCAAYTEVDNAEKEFELANLINYKAVELLAKISKKNNTALIHISTDYVFDGKNNIPYDETHKVNPINAYGKSKLSGEEIIKDLMPKNAIIVRTSWLYSDFGKNFVDSIIRNAKQQDKINVINDQFGSPTYAADLAQVLCKIINALSKGQIIDKTELYHFSNEGSTSWYRFACEIVKLAKIDCNINPINSDQYKSLANRPKYSRFSKLKISKKFALEIRHWDIALEDCIKNLNLN
jgi:dTDP-4-dehydrorhamnose reductase